MNAFFIRFMFYLIEQQGKKNRSREIQQKHNEIDDQSVRHYVPKIDILQKSGKMFESDPLAEQERPQQIGRVIRILESEKQTDHRNIMKQENIDESERRDDKHRPVPRVPFFPLFLEKSVLHFSPP